MRSLKSPLRYPGGKERARKVIVPMINDFIEYREAMFGGGSIGLALLQKYPLRRFKFNDLDQELMCFWNILKWDNEELYRAVMEIRRTIRDPEEGKKLFQELKERTSIISLNRAVRYYILNRLSFSGLTNTGGYSEFNFRKRFTQSKIRELTEFRSLLATVDLSNLDYEEFVKAPGENVFIYLDPPYHTAKEHRMYGDQGELHTEFDHERLARVMKDVDHRWLITLDDCEFIRELFDFAYIEEFELQYGMNNVGGVPAETGKELIITNYDPNEGKQSYLQLELM